MTLGGQYSDRLIDLSQILMTDLGLCFYNTLKKIGCAYFCTPSYLQIYKIPKIPLRIKKIDCLTTTNLVNLKSNTMKNTMQIYRIYVIQHTFRILFFYVLTFVMYILRKMCDLLKYLI